MSPLVTLLQNAAFLLAIALVFDLRNRWPLARTLGGQLMLGALVGLVGVATMLLPLRIEPGLVLDSRGVLLAIAGLFFGAIPTAVAVVLALLYRVLVIGGPAATVGATYILATAALGLAVRAWRRERLADFPGHVLAGLGAAVGLVQFALTVVLLRSDAGSLAMRFFLPMVALNLVATLALGLLLRARLRRERTDHKLAESEASFRALVEQVPAIVYRSALDAHSSTLYISPEVESLGYTAEEWLVDPLRWSRLIHPDDSASTIAQIESDRTAGRASELVYRIKAADGSWRHVRDLAEVVRDPEGKDLYLQGLMFDITEQVAAEQEAKLRAVALDSAADAIAITDPNGDITWVNRAFTGLTGFGYDEAIGNNPRSLLRSGSQDRFFYERMWNTLLSGRVWKGELVNQRKDGSQYTEEQTVTPVKDASGQITHFIAIKRDLTDRRELEMQYRQSQKMEGIGRLAGGIAHDLNNLLTVINGTIELAIPSVAERSDLRADLLEIRRATDRAAALTRQLLAFSRQQVMRTEVLDLNKVVGVLMNMLTRVIGEDVDVKTRLAPDLANIRADSGQLEQVLLNLSINARDAMPEGGLLTIETLNVELDEDFSSRHISVRPGPHVALVVNDNGTGMEQNTQARIFEPFFTTKPPGKGTGLGLSTVYGIVKQSGGSIWVYSEVGKGTTFKIYFPAVDEPIRERPSGTSRLLTGGHETVLVVEDEDAIRHVAVRVLERQGYVVLDAAGGPEALERAGAHTGPVQLLMTDMVMPEMTGPELAQELKARQPDLKILFTSGYSADAVVSEFGVKESVNFISKPYSLADLTREVRRILDEAL